MTNPQVGLGELLKALTDVDRTEQLDDETVWVDPIESQPGEDVPIESGPIIYDDGWGQHPHDEPPNESGPIFWEPTPAPGEAHEPGPTAPAPGPASDPGPVIWEDPTYPGDDANDGPTCPPDHDPSQGPNPEDGYEPDAPPPEEPAPGDYPEDKNCWDPAYY
ncbi:MAG: hypothetical protein ACRDSK_12955 [Actinophytocola sp.]|uniref:hypothetical protein n=1 Tax=Actinophytocola sp. TaxID=1872138 RepID=UPI003D6AC2D1